MILTYRYRIYPNAAQVKTLEKMLFAVFVLYNDSLAVQRDNYAQHSKHMNYNEIAKYWTRVVNRHPEHPVARLPNDTRARVLEWQKVSYNEFFKYVKRLKKGEQNGRKYSPPHMRKLRDTRTVPFRGRTRERLHEYHRPGGEPCINIQGIGEIKTVYHRPVPNDARILWAQLSRDGKGHWYANLQCDFTRRDLPEMYDGWIGVDVGLKAVIATNEGDLLHAPLFLKQQLRELRIMQRKNDRQRRANNPQNYNPDGTVKKGARNWVVSNRQRKTETQIKVLHHKVTQQRRHFWHEVTDYLTRNYSHIALEDLTLEFMIKNNRLSRDVADCAIGMFWEMLKYKAAERGCTLIWVNPAYTSQTCAECGHVEKENRSTRDDFKCRACGHEDHADVNAARNILARGLSNEALTDDNENAA